jgi:glycerol-3-phosphate O-acyltransferase
VKIVPVSINYDRIFEASYLANEMISGKFQNLNLYELMRNISSQRRGKLGKIFVKYAEPIDLSDYLANSRDQSMEQVALNLTKELYHVQQREQPITMNSLISTSLFYQPE